MKLIVSSLKYSYDKKELVLRDISFVCQNVPMLAIVGASGCGKSTLLRLLAGLISTDDLTSIKINGLTPKKNTDEGRVGYMFQQASLFPNLTVKQNIMLPLKIGGVADEAFVDNLIDKVGLSAYCNYLPTALSGGMKTRVALARTFVTKPSLILLDEPFGDLDVKWKNILYSELESLREEFCASVVIVTHDIDEAILLSDDILVMSEQGSIQDNLHINTKLQRVYDSQRLFSLGSERKHIRDLIIGIK